MFLQKSVRGKREETLGIADIIGVLGNEFSNIYLVDCESQNIEIYRYENEKVGVKEFYTRSSHTKPRSRITLRRMYFQRIRRKCSQSWILTMYVRSFGRCRSLPCITG